MITIENKFSFFFSKVEIKRKTEGIIPYSTTPSFTNNDLRAQAVVYGYLYPLNATAPKGEQLAFTMEILSAEGVTYLGLNASEYSQVCVSFLSSHKSHEV